MTKAKATPGEKALLADRRARVLEAKDLPPPKHAGLSSVSPSVSAPTCPSSSLASTTASVSALPSYSPSTVRREAGLQLIVEFLNGDQWSESQDKIIDTLHAIWAGRETEMPRFEPVSLHSRVVYEDGEYVVDEQPEVPTNIRYSQEDPGHQVWWFLCAALRCGELDRITECPQCGTFFLARPVDKSKGAPTKYCRPECRVEFEKDPNVQHQREFRRRRFGTRKTNTTKRSS